LKDIDRHFVARFSQANSSTKASNSSSYDNDFHDSNKPVQTREFTVKWKDIVTIEGGDDTPNIGFLLYKRKALCGT
jgi:hypothetical protein